EVDGDHVVPTGGADAIESLADRLACIVDQDVHAATPLTRPGEGLGDGNRVADVGRHVTHAVRLSETMLGVTKRALTSPQQRDTGAQFEQPLGDRVADAA